MQYRINVFTDYVIEGAYQKAFRRTGNVLRQYLTSGFIHFKIPLAINEFIPLCEGIVYPDVHPTKVLENYTEEENELYNRLLETASTPFEAITVYKTSSLLRGIVYFTKEYVDASIFSGQEQLAEMTYDQLGHYIGFLLRNIKPEFREGTIDMLDEFVEFIPTINNNYFYDNTDGSQVPWSKMASNQVLNNLRNAIQP